MNKLIIYLLRWQLSSPLYALFFGTLIKYGYSYFEVAMLSNLVGAFLFFLIDKWLFNKKMPITHKSFTLYSFRWQTGTPLYMFLTNLLDNYISNYTYISIIINLIGGLIYYNVDKYIFSINNK